MTPAVDLGDPRLPARFWAKVCVDAATGCWTWSASLTSTGYGQMTVGRHGDGSRRNATAHRLAYETLVGPVPDGLEIDHLCRNRACANPAHLEAVTRAENIRRGMAPAVVAARCRSVAHCPRGHAYDDANTARDKDGRRTCRECKRVRQRLAHRRRKERLDVGSAGGLAANPKEIEDGVIAEIERSRAAGLKPTFYGLVLAVFGPAVNSWRALANEDEVRKALRRLRRRGVVRSSRGCWEICLVTRLAVAR